MDTMRKKRYEASDDVRRLEMKYEEAQDEENQFYEANKEVLDNPAHEDYETLNHLRMELGKAERDAKHLFKKAQREATAARAKVDASIEMDKLEEEAGKARAAKVRAMAAARARE